MKDFFDTRNKSFVLFSCIYFLTLIGSLVGVFLKSTTIEIIFKPFLAITLISYYLTNTKRNNLLYIIILGFVFLNDIFNVFNHKDFYLYIVCVMTTIYFILYAIFFLKKRKTSVTKVLLIFLLFASCMGIAFWVIIPGTTIIFELALINSLSLLFLCSLVFNNLLDKNNRHNRLYFIAFFLLIIGNSLFGIYRFHQNLILIDMMVIILYAIAQYLICNVILQEENEELM